MDDYITLTAGYAFEPPSPEALALVHEVFEQIYPDDAELDIVHRFAGYILSGRTAEKYFLALTDRRRGDNGKSTVLRLLCKALGKEYSVNGRKGELMSRPDCGARSTPDPSLCRLPLQDQSRRRSQQSRCGHDRVREQAPGGLRGARPPGAHRHEPHEGGQPVPTVGDRGVDSVPTEMARR